MDWLGKNDAAIFGARKIVRIITPEGEVIYVDSDIKRLRGQLQGVSQIVLRSEYQQLKIRKEEIERGFYSPFPVDTCNMVVSQDAQFQTWMCVMPWNEKVIRQMDMKVRQKGQMEILNDCDCEVKQHPDQMIEFGDLRILS